VAVPAAGGNIALLMEKKGAGTLAVAPLVPGDVVPSRKP
jgi:hypothetical protein